LAPWPTRDNKGQTDTKNAQTCSKARSNPLSSPSIQVTGVPANTPSQRGTAAKHKPARGTDEERVPHPAHGGSSTFAK